MTLIYNGIFVILYNNKNKAIELVDKMTNKEYICIPNRDKYYVDLDGTTEIHLCRADIISARRCFQGVELRGFTTADDSLYCGETIRFVLSRIRPMGVE